MGARFGANAFRDLAWGFRTTGSGNGDLGLKAQ